MVRSQDDVHALHPEVGKVRQIVAPELLKKN